MRRCPGAQPAPLPRPTASLALTLVLLLLLLAALPAGPSPAAGGAPATGRTAERGPSPLAQGPSSSPVAAPPGPSSAGPTSSLPGGGTSSPGGAAPSGTACPAADKVLAGNLSAVTTTTTSQSWAASYPTSEAGFWVEGFTVSASAGFEGAGGSAGAGRATFTLLFSAQRFAPWGGPGTSVAGTPPGTPVESWTLSVGGGSQGAETASTADCRTLTVPSASPYATLVVTAGSSALPGLLASISVSLFLVAPGGAQACQLGATESVGTVAGTTSGTPRTALWGASDPAARPGLTLTGYQVTLGAGYSGAASLASQFGRVEAYLLASPSALTGWDAAGQAVSALPAGATLLGEEGVAVVGTGQAGNVALAVRCLGVLVPSNAPYLSVVLAVNTTVASSLVGTVAVSFFLSAGGLGAQGCPAGSGPQYGGLTDTLPPATTSASWGGSDPDVGATRAQNVSEVEVSLAQWYSGTPVAAPWSASTLFELVATASPWSSWNSSGQSVAALPAGTVVLGAWQVVGSSEGDHAAVSSTALCLHLAVPYSLPYLGIFVATQGVPGLTAAVQLVAFFSGAAPFPTCGTDRGPAVQPGEADALALAGSSAEFAASDPTSLAGELLTGVALSASVAHNGASASRPSGGDVLAWLLLSATPFGGDHGAGTSLTGLPAGEVVAALELAPGSADGSASLSGVSSCLHVVVPSSTPFATVLLALRTGPVGSLVAGVEAEVQAQPLAQATPCVAPAAFQAPGTEVGGEGATLPSAGTGWFAASDPTNLSGAVITSVDVSASLGFSPAAGSPAYGTVAIGLFFSPTPYSGWNGSGASLGGAPSQAGQLQQATLRLGAGNTSSASTTASSCQAVRVGSTDPYLTVLLTLTSPFLAGLQGEVLVAVGTATPLPLGASLRSNLPAGDVNRTSFALSAGVSGDLPPDTYAWDLGDGTLSSGPTVAHVYARAGAFVVRVTVNDSLGRSAVASTTLYVYLGPSLAIRVSPATGGATGEALRFNATVGGGAPPPAFVWRFGDGGVGAFQNLTHTYNAPGTYLVEAWYNDSVGASSSATLPVSVVTALALAPSAQPSPAEAGDPVVFGSGLVGGAPPVGVAWRFGDGGSGGGANATYIYAAAGTYTAWAFANDSVGRTVAAPVTVTVLPRLQVAITLSANVTRAGPGAVVTVTAGPQGGSGTYLFAWSLNGSALADASPVLRFDPAGTGNFSFGLEVTDSAGYRANASALLTALPPLGVHLRATPSELGPGDALVLTASVYAPEGTVAYAWSGLPDGCTGGDVDRVACSPGTVGHYAVGVTVTDARGYRANGYADVNVSSASTGGSSSVDLKLVVEVSAAAGILGVAAALLLAVRRRRHVPPQRAAGGTGAGHDPGPAEGTGPPPSSPEGTGGPGPTVSATSPGGTAPSAVTTAARSAPRDPAIVGPPPATSGATAPRPAAGARPELPGAVPAAPRPTKDPAAPRSSGP